MAQPNYEWLAADVAGTPQNLTAKLNQLESEGWEIFTVTALLFPNQHGWAVVCRKELPKAEQKKHDEKQQEEPKPDEGHHAPQQLTERSRRGTVTLKPRR